jgi:hypothetical protein
MYIYVYISRQSKVSLVDLAGSERASLTGRICVSTYSTYLIITNCSFLHSHAIYTYIRVNTYVYLYIKIILIILIKGAHGDRLVEANNINKSLSSLGDVIKSLSSTTDKGMKPF